jgi:transposase InsO family protein
VTTVAPLAKGPAATEIRPAPHDAWLDDPGQDALRQHLPADGPEAPGLGAPDLGAGAPPIDAAAALLAASLRHPASGWVQMHAALRLKGLAGAPADTRRLLRELGVATAHERWLRLEAELCATARPPSDEQRAFLAEHNPCWWERGQNDPPPGVLCHRALCLAQCHREWEYTVCRMRHRGWFYVGEAEAPRCIWLHLAVDTATMAGFALMDRTDLREAAVPLLHDQALNFYRAEGVPIAAVVTRARRDFCGYANGCMERFKRTVLSEFFRAGAHRRFYESFGVAQGALEHWLRFYNTEREHPGYPNGGRTPLEMMRQAAARSGAAAG